MPDKYTTKALILQPVSSLALALLFMRIISIDLGLYELLNQRLSGQKQFYSYTINLRLELRYIIFIFLTQWLFWACLASAVVAKWFGYKILALIIGADFLSCNDEFWLHDSKENMQNQVSVLIFPRNKDSAPFDAYMKELYSRVMGQTRWNVQLGTILGKHYLFKQRKESFEEYY